ncbi:iron-containing alcohol dehydrogenase [Ferruginivarius sediminum]|uniref:Alcohol dehydrogenase 2 n=1 Tax=Ferruginivarius sediminum TaxID=2661937 RepID=A0A369T8T5_9PROT|nr:iron-containing alcohol dehydrogenase [Ferruginivarius sediminum]
MRRGRQVTADSQTSYRGDWSWPAPTRFGAGRIDELARACAELRLTRPLVVIDPGVAALPPLAAALESLPEHRRFDAVRGNPDEASVAEAVGVYRDGGHDGVIAVGGGSALDTGKAVALLALQTRDPWDFMFGRPMPDDAAPVQPVVAVPTTAGTGSEFSASAVVVEPAAHAKRSLWHPDLLPRRVILDPALTLSLPRHLTIWTGLDALIHNLEAYLAPGHHPMADAVALSAISRIADALPRLAATPADLDARAEMLAASAMGAAAFDKGLGGVHALSHAVSAACDTHHGLTNAVLLPYVLRFNLGAAEARMAEIARGLNLRETSGEALIGWVESFNAALDIPRSLAEIGATGADSRMMARVAVEDANAAANPRPLNIESVTAILDRALSGAIAQVFR